MYAYLLVQQDDNRLVSVELATPPPLCVYRTGALYTNVLVCIERRARRLPRMRASRSEYYFSEANLSRDAYLRSQMGAGGLVSVDTLLRFRRLSQLRASPELILKVCSSITRTSTRALYAHFRITLYAHIVAVCASGVGADVIVK